MTPLFRKLNLTSQSLIHGLNAPASFTVELEKLAGVEVKRELNEPCSFVMVFAISQAQVDSASQCVLAWAQGDAVVWMVYPKRTSRK